MSFLPWKKRDLERQLSAHLDGELDAGETLSLGEHLVFDAELCQTLAAYAQTDDLIGRALEPETRPDAQAFADDLVAGLGAADPPPLARRWIKPAVWASVGILVTAGLTIAGLKRQGLV
jgi:anti-sigma factor RsiW